MPEPQDQNDWDEYRRLVLSELKRLSTGLENTNVSVEACRVEIAKLQIKSGVWGGLSGLLVTLGALLLALLTGKVVK